MNSKASRSARLGQRLSVCSHGWRWELPFCPLWLIVLAFGALRGKERILGKFCSFRGVHARGDVSFPQFTNSVACVGIYRRGDALWGIAYRRLQNTHGLRPLWSSAFVICYRHGYRSWHQDAIRLFGLLGGRRSILTGVLGA